MKLLATNSYSGGGQATGSAQQGAGLLTFCLRNNLFDTNSKKDIERLLARARQEKVKAVILENFFMGHGMMSISYGQIEFARRLYDLGIETFFVGRIGPSVHGCELWRAHKPCSFEDMKKPVPQLARVGTFGTEVFRTTDGKVLPRGSGDGGIETVDHHLHFGSAFQERDWPAIVKAVTKEMA